MEIIKSQSATTYRRRNHRLADENGVHDQPETLHPCKECKMNEILNKKPKRTPRSSEDARIWPEESPVRELGTEGLGGGERSRYRGSKSTKTASDYNSAGDAARGVDEIEARRGEWALESSAATPRRFIPCSVFLGHVTVRSNSSSKPRP